MTFRVAALLCLLMSSGAAQEEGEFENRPPPGFGHHGGPPGFQMPPEQARVEQLLRQFESTKPGLMTRVGRLRALGELYPDPPDFDRVINERTSLRMELVGDAQNVESAVQDVKAALMDLRASVRRFNPELLAQGEGAGPFKPIHRAMNGMSQLSNGIKAALEQDEQAFTKAAVLERRQRRRLVIVGVVVLGLVSLGGGFVLLQRRIISSAVADATQRATLAMQAKPPVITQTAEEPGRVIGDNFRIEKHLGTGGMGVVYLATDQTLRRRVAIKRMRDELLSGGADSEGFLNEARLVAALKHPNIVEILSIVKEPGRLYLVFEYVEGKSLLEWITLQKQLPLPAVKSVLHQMGAALDYAHAQKIVHRDLKPANVMVDMRGAVKVMDFGIAHQAQMTLARVTNTDRSGTPAYMAPEQELGSASRAADVFAAGVCLYEMLTGRLPYGGPNFQAQKMAMRFSPPSALVPGLPPQLDAIILRALAADPDRRFASAGELSQAVLAL